MQHVYISFFIETLLDSTQLFELYYFQHSMFCDLYADIVNTCTANTTQMLKHI